MSNNKRPFINVNLFELIDSEEKAYWLGFLYADGYVATKENKICLGLSIEDIIHVEKFKKFIGLDNKIYIKTIKNKYQSCNYSFRSTKMKDDLIALGCTTQKSLTLKFPSYNQVPKDLMKHFIRGYIDGDGWICATSETVCFGVIGTEQFLQSMIQEFDLKQNQLASVHDGTNKRYQLYAIKELQTFLDYIYKDATIYLQRKYNNYLKIKQLPTC